MGKKLVTLGIFWLCLCLFACETLRAFGVVSFHSEFFRKKGTILVDAGHGGEDGGAVGVNGALEKDINLAIALALAKDLKANNFEVILVRDGDYAVGDLSLPTVAQRKRSDIRQRLQMLEEAGEDCLYVGIHQNFFTQGQYSGAQVFYAENGEQSLQLAEAIRQNITASLQPENHRENKPAGEGIFILKNARQPAVLVECGFLSNAAEAEKLCQPGHQQDMAAAIYNGIVDYVAAQAEKGKESIA